MNRYKELKVWQKAVELSVMVYNQTEKLPSKEQFGLISQINRAVISIPSNIAEGAGRGTTKEFSYFLNVALASSFELETQLIISEKLGYIKLTDLEVIQEELSAIQNMIVGLKKSLT